MTTDKSDVRKSVSRYMRSLALKSAAQIKDTEADRIRSQKASAGAEKRKAARASATSRLATSLSETMARC
jgi:hypothetical protein